MSCRNYTQYIKNEYQKLHNPPNLYRLLTQLDNRLTTYHDNCILPVSCGVSW